MNAWRIPFLDLTRINNSFEPALSDALLRVARSGQYIRGSEVAKFEEAYAAYTGSRYCVGVGNGFDSLRLIFRAWMVMGIVREGDEVLVPANTYIASILAVVENRLRPVFVEPDPDTMNLDAQSLESCVTVRTRAVLVVHLYGRNAMTPEVAGVARKHGLKVVEDNAQAAGCMGIGRRTGSLGDAAGHSFFPSKNLGALGDAGAVTTDDAALADMVRTMGNYGSDHKGFNSLPGVNSRLDELQAAVLNVKLPRLDEDNARRRSIAARYREGIINQSILLPRSAPREDEHVWHLFVVRCHRRDALQQHLSAQGIQTLIHYRVPPHKQRAFASMNELRFPRTEKLHEEALSLPLHPQLSESEIDSVIRIVSAFP